jgi:NADH dehydrogenase
LVRDVTGRDPRVVIVGAGFAGLYAAKGLRGAAVRLTVVDRRNHHLFQPLLYQVATAGLAAPDIAAPIRRVLRRQRNATVLLAEARRIEPERRRVVLVEGELHYDYLIVATGATHNYFGHDQWRCHAPGLKNVEDAFEIRRRILLAFEAAERETDPDQRDAQLTFVIVGAGPTGVELAGALREIAQRTLARDFRNFDPRATRVVLVDAADRVLPSFPEGLSHKARAMLRDRGVEVRTRSCVKEIDATGVTLEGSDDSGAELARIPARTVLWAAGVKPSPLAESLEAPRDELGRVCVEPDLSLPGHPEIFVIGDLARVDQDGQPVPGMAPPAIQEGRHAAATIRADLAGRPRPAFRYRDRGMLATVGRKAGVAWIHGFGFTGFLAWVLWLVVHITWLIGFRNRLVVLFEWAWAYLTYQRGARVILEPSLLAANGRPLLTPRWQSMAIEAGDAGLPPRAASGDRAALTTEFRRDTLEGEGERGRGGAA